MNRHIIDSSMASGAPTESTPLHILRSGTKSRRDILTNSPLPRAYQKAATAQERANAMQVAQAAPARPMPNPNISTGSRTMFAAAPATWIAMERLAAPSPRSMPDITPLRTTKMQDA